MIREQMALWLLQQTQVTQCKLLSNMHVTLPNPRQTLLFQRNNEKYHRGKP